MAPKKGDLISISEFGCQCLYNMNTVVDNNIDVLFGPKDWHMRERIIEDIKKWIPEYVFLLLETPKVLSEEGLYFIDLLYGDKRLSCTFNVTSDEDIEKVLMVRMKGTCFI